MWEQLVAERGGVVLRAAGEANGAGEAQFACLLDDDDGLLPLIARLDAATPTFLLKSGRVGGGAHEAGSLAITGSDAAAALDAALDADARWEADPDHGLELLVSGAPDVAEGLLIPRFLYRRADRIYEYAAEMPAALARLRALLGEPRPQ